MIRNACCVSMRAAAPSAPLSEPAVSNAASALGPKQPAMLLFGRDDNGRPHASCFAGHNMAEVERAAGLMGLMGVAAATDELRDLPAKLLAGNCSPAAAASSPSSPHPCRRHRPTRRAPPSRHAPQGQCEGHR